MQYGNEHRAGQRSQFLKIKSPKWSRGCICDRKFAFRRGQSVAMCMIHNGVEHFFVASEGICIRRSIRNVFLFDVIVNHTHRGVLASTKRIISIASATPGPLGALDPSKAAPLSCVVRVPILHDRPTWMFQNVELLPLSAPGWEGCFS